MDATKIRELANKLSWIRDGITQLELANSVSAIRIEFRHQNSEIKHTTINEELEALSNEEFDSLKSQLLDRMKVKVQYIEQDIAIEVSKK